MNDYQWQPPKTRRNNKLISKQEAKQQADNKYNQSIRFKRDKREAAFYQSSAWRKKRVLILKRDHHMCVECRRELEAGKEATGTINQRLIIDHIIDLKKDWSKRLDSDNLQTLCIVHHNKKTFKK